MKKMSNLNRGSLKSEPKVFKGYHVQIKEKGKKLTDQIQTYVVPWEMAHNSCKL